MASPRVEVRPFTGQRNENSVLFSLANLSALAASGTAKETPKGGLSSTAATEGGSGLIDIRAMAQATLASTKSSDGGSVDELPSFAPTLSPLAAPVLMPVADEGMPKWVWPIIGLGGVLVIAIVVMLVMLVGRSKPPVVVAPTGVIAAAPGGSVTPTPQAPQTPTGAPGMQPEGSAGGSGGAGPTVAMATPAGSAGGSAGSATEKQETKKEEPKADDKKKPVKVAAAGRKAKDPKEAKTEKEAQAEPKATSPKEAKAHAEPKAAAGKQDDLDCLLDPSKPGCKGAKKARETKEGAAKAESSGGGDLKDRLEPGDIQKGMRGIKGKVQACYDQYKVPGMVQVSVTIAPSGKVTSATVTGKFAGTPTGSCVAGAVKSAQFDRFKGAPLTITYPFVLR